MSQELDPIRVDHSTRPETGLTINTQLDDKVAEIATAGDSLELIGLLSAMAQLWHRTLLNKEVFQDEYQRGSFMLSVLSRLEASNQGLSDLILASDADKRWREYIANKNNTPHGT